MAANSWINFKVPVQIIKVLGLLRKQLGKWISGGLSNDLIKVWYCFLISSGNSQEDLGEKLRSTSCKTEVGILSCEHIFSKTRKVWDFFHRRGKKKLSEGSLAKSEWGLYFFSKWCLEIHVISFHFQSPSWYLFHLTFSLLLSFSPSPRFCAFPSLFSSS